MARLHLLEIEDQPWCPAWVRDAGTDWIALALRLSGQAKRLAPVFLEQLALSGQSEVVELASGGGGPTPTLVEAALASGARVHVTLTDLYPNVPTLERIAAKQPESFAFERQPVDAAAVPARLSGMRMMVNSFHHLRPEVARGVLADAAKHGRSIAIFEVVERSPVAVVGILFGALFSPVTMPITGPRRWERWVFSWIVPVLPLFVLWDGVVSCMRVYSPDELRALTASIDAPGYRWEIRRVPIGGPAVATCLFGHPPAS
jgi:hypothetical protein